MFSDGSVYGHPAEPRLYSQAADYGILCRVQDLADIIQGVNGFLKKNKIRTAGMATRFGVTNSGYQTKEKCWTEWIMDVYMGPRSHNPPERDGNFVDFDTPEDREKREAFFQALLNSIGHPLEILHEYQPEETSLGCPLWGSWFWSNGGWIPVDMRQPQCPAKRTE